MKLGGGIEYIGSGDDACSSVLPDCCFLSAFVVELCLVNSFDALRNITGGVSMSIVW